MNYEGVCFEQSENLKNLQSLKNLKTAGEDACALGHYSNTIIILYYRKII